MPKRLIAALVGVGALAAAVPMQAHAQSAPPEVAVLCDSVSDAVLEQELDLSPVTRVRLKLICINSGDGFDAECRNGLNALFNQDLNLSPITRVRLRLLCIRA